MLFLRELLRCLSTDGLVFRVVSLWLPLAAFGLSSHCFLFIRSGTSMVSLIIPPGDQISRVNKMLTDEAGTASNIKREFSFPVVLEVLC